MGLDITGNMVTVNHGHGRWLNTDTNGNPICTAINGLSITSIFRRKKAPASANIKHGDNCPLLYALKNKNGLVTDKSSIKMLLPNFYTISAGAFKTNYDLVIPMPSSHKISEIIAKRIAKLNGCTFDCNVFSKATVVSAISTLSTLSIPVSDKRKIDYVLKKQISAGLPFSMKDIPTRYRHYFLPLTMTNQPTGAVRKILLVDDLLATGTTLITARNLLSAAMPGVQIDAACLFSAIRSFP